MSYQVAIFTEINFWENSPKQHTIPLSMFSLSLYPASAKYVQKCFAEASAEMGASTEARWLSLGISRA